MTYINQKCVKNRKAIKCGKTAERQDMENMTMRKGGKNP